MSKPAKFNTTITGVYKLSNGSYWSMDLDARAYDALQTARVGDKLLFKPVSEGTKEAKGERFPDAFLEIIPKESLKSFPQSSRSETKTRARTAKPSAGNGSVLPKTGSTETSSDDWG